MICPTYQRLLTAGDLPDAAGGLYNPGAVVTRDGRRYLLVRRETTPDCSGPAHATIFELPARGLAHGLHWTLVPIGHHADARLEDFRPFLFGEDCLIAHTVVRPGLIKPGLSLAGTAGPTLTRYDDWVLPSLPLRPVEKNWMLLACGADLYTVYSLDPLILFQRRPNPDTPGWVRHSATSTHWTARIGQPPRLSTHLLPFEGGFLGWWHIVFDGAYAHGAYYLDQELRLSARTGILFDGAWVRSGFKPGVLYVTSQLDDQDGILLFYGEGDAHSGMTRLAKADLIQALWPGGRS